MGLMIESYLLEGAQDPNGSDFGRSITDPCLAGGFRKAPLGHSRNAGLTIPDPAGSLIPPLIDNSPSEISGAGPGKTVKGFRERIGRIFSMGIF